MCLSLALQDTWPFVSYQDIGKTVKLNSCYYTFLALIFESSNILG